LRVSAVLSHGEGSLPSLQESVGDAMKPVEGEERRIILATDLAENAVTLPAPASGPRRPLRSPPRGFVSAHGPGAC